MGPRASGGRVGFKSGGAVKKASGGPVLDHVSKMAGNLPSGGKVGTQSGPTQVSSSKPMTSKQASSLDPSHPPVHIKNRAMGGKVDMDCGAGGGMGRLEKIKAYGKNAKAKK
jgi:hypothetical protein